MFIQYDDKAIEHLKKRDKLLAEAIDTIGHINRPAESDLFSSVIHHIVGQQISVAAQKTVWKRLCDKLGDITPDIVCAIEDSELQSCGLSFRKVEYIKDFSKKVQCGEFDIEKLWTLSDEEVTAELSALKGIGVWTAEMLMTFCMGREDIVSFGDLAILRGMRMLYHHRKIDRKLFEKYRRRYSPYGTVASLYLWAIAGGAIEGMKDYAPKKQAVKKAKK